MSQETPKSNSDVLKDTTDLQQPVDTTAFDTQVAPASVSDTSSNQPNDKIVDVSALPSNDVGFDDFNNALAGVTKAAPVVEPKKEEVKVEEKKPEEVAKETKVEVKPAAVKKEDAAAPSHKGIPRDYTGFTPEEVALLKRTSNEAFSYIAPKLKEAAKLGEIIKTKDNEIAQLKTGKQILPDSYFEHPQAFILTKEFNDNAQELQKASTIQQHWRAQMANIRKGEPWHDLEIDAKGQLRLGAKRNADADSEAEVLDNMQFAGNQVNDYRSKVSAIENNFKQKHAAAVEILKKAEKDNFAAYDEPNHPMKPLMENLRKNIPAEFRNNPMSEIMVKAATAAVQFGNLYRTALAENVELKKQLEAKGGVVKEVKEDDRKKLGGPTNGDLSANGGGGKNETALGNDFSDFTKAMEM